MVDEKHGESSTPKDERRHSTTRYLRLNRLPTLQEVLDRRTRPPLDLFCFYRESAEDALDFWLDAQQHENLCKAYFKDLKKSGRTIDEDWPEFAHYARQNGSHFSPLLLFSDRPDEYLEGAGGHGRSSMSAARHRHEAGNNVNSLHQPDFSRTPMGSPLPGSGSAGNINAQRADGQASPALSGRSRGRRDTESHGHRNITPPAGASGLSGEADGNGEFGQNNVNMQDGTAGPGRTTFSRMSVRTWAQRPKERRSKAPTIIQRDRAIEKSALVESAERIYLRYLLGGAEKEIYLPPSLRIPDFPDSPPTHPSPLIPDLFHAQKTYIYRALEADAFPRFLRAKAFANLTPAGAFWRLVLGLLVLWGSFVTGFSLVFLAYPRRTRIWTILPFFIALNLLLSAYYSLSPLLALFQRSETSPFRTMRVREGYVRKLLAMRAAWIEAVCVVGTAVLACIFIFVPGHRL